MSTATAIPTPGPGPGGWVRDYLRDPAGTLDVLLDRLGDLATTWAPILAPMIAVAAGIVAYGRRWLTRHRNTRLAADARLVTVLAPPEVDPAGGPALWANLVGLLRPAWRRRLAGQPHLVFEYLFGHTGATIRVWVPGRIPPGLVERAIQAAWPGAHTHTTPADPSQPTQAGDTLVVVGGELRLARSEALPIRTDLDVDPTRALFAAAAGLTPGEQVCVQVLARPVTGARLRRARRAGRHLTTGHTPHPVGRLLDLLTPTSRPSSAHPAVDRQVALEQSATNRAIVTKQHAPQYETLVRYATTTHVGSKPGLHAARDRARGRAHAVAAVFATFSDHNHYRRRRLHHPTRTLNERRLGRGDLLSVPELAAVAHLPTDAALPALARAGAHAIAPPPGVPAHGPDIKPLGVTDTTPARPVGLAAADARHHLHILGATGSGKSTLMANMILADVAAGRGAVVIDPKGDLVTDLLTRLSDTAAGKVVVFDPDAPGRPPCLNPLDGGDTDTTVDHLTSVFRRVYAAFWGPRTDDILRAACLTLRAQPGIPTLADLPRLLSDPAYRDRTTRAVTDPVLRGFWTWYDQLSDPARAQAVAPLMNKLRGFLLRPFVRHAIAGGPSTVHMTDILDGGLCLVRIPKGTLGDDTTNLLGSLILARTWQGVTARAHQPPARRRDAAIYIDECHNFLNLPYPIEDMLAEARGFHVSLTLAHQHLTQLGHELRDGIATNARNKIYFTASPDDARDLARHTSPRLTEHDLAHLDVFHAAARLVLAGQQADPFTLTTGPLPPPVRSLARARRATNHPASTTPATRAAAATRSEPRPAPGRADPRRTG